jgi:hypothetical protein
MKIELYDKIMLKDGDQAYIVEIFDDGKVFVADVDRDDGTHTEWVLPQEIDKVIQ